MQEGYQEVILAQGHPRCGQLKFPPQMPGCEGSTPPIEPYQKVKPTSYKASKLDCWPFFSEVGGGLLICT